MSLYIGTVESVTDEWAGGRIQARILPIDRDKTLKGDRTIPYAFPLLPKMVHVMPKVGEAVLVLVTDDSDKELTQRFYIGPIISQPQYMYKDTSVLGATTLLTNSPNNPTQSVNNNGETNGAFANTDEIALYGRKNSDIILSDNDVRVRSGARLSNPQKPNSVVFNRESPAFMKVKYHEDGLTNPALPQYAGNSSATLVGDEINLISNCGSPYFTTNSSDGQIEDKDMQKIIDEAHVLPYGDVLVDFLLKFLAMFKNHTHKYHNLQPCPDDFSNAFDSEYGYQPAKTANDGSYTKKLNGRVVEDVGKTFQGLGDKLLSKHVRIN